MPHDEIKLTRIERKLDAVLERTANIDVTLAKQEMQLGEHMRRTAAAEHGIEVLKSNNLKYAIGIISALATLIASIWLKYV